MTSASFLAYSAFSVEDVYARVVTRHVSVSRQLFWPNIRFTAFMLTFRIKT